MYTYVVVQNFYHQQYRCNPRPFNPKPTTLPVLPSRTPKAAGVGRSAREPILRRGPAARKLITDLETLGPCWQKPYIHTYIHIIYIYFMYIHIVYMYICILHDSQIPLTQTPHGCPQGSICSWSCWGLQTATLPSSATPSSLATLSTGHDLRPGNLVTTSCSTRTNKGGSINRGPKIDPTIL